jgi:hypothetical protein
MVLYFSSNATGNISDKCIRDVAECRLAEPDERESLPSDTEMIFRAVPRAKRVEAFEEQMLTLATLGFITLWSNSDAKELAKRFRVPTLLQQLNNQRKSAYA